MAGAYNAGEWELLSTLLDGPLHWRCGLTGKFVYVMLTPLVKCIQVLHKLSSRAPSFYTIQDDMEDEDSIVVAL